MRTRLLKKMDCGLFWVLGQIWCWLSLKTLIEFSQINSALKWLIKLISAAVCVLVNSSPQQNTVSSCGEALSNKPIVNWKLSNEWHTYLQSLVLEWKSALSSFCLCLQSTKRRCMLLLSDYNLIEPMPHSSYTISTAIDTIMSKISINLLYPISLA